MEIFPSRGRKGEILERDANIKSWECWSWCLDRDQGLKWHKHYKLPECEHRNHGLSQVKLLQDVILSVYLNLAETLHWHSKDSFEPFEIFVLSLQ